MKLEVSAQPPPPRAARRSISGYLVFWVLLAMGAIGYLGLVAARPDLIVARLSPAQQQAAEPTASDRRTAELADELVNLRRWLTDLQREFAETRATVNQQASTEKSLVEKVATIEERLTTHEPNTETPPADQTAKPKSAASLGTEQVLKAMAGASAEPRMQPPPARTNAASAEQVVPKAAKIATAPIATGTIPPPPAPTARPIALGPAKVVTPPQPRQTLGIELSGGTTLEALRSSWDQLAQQHKQVLNRLTPRYRTALQGEDQPLRLVAGPFTNQAEASRACAALRSRQVTCRIGAFTGNAL